MLYLSIMLSYISKKRTILKSVWLILPVLFFFCGCKGGMTGTAHHHVGDSAVSGNVSLSLPVELNTEKLTANEGLPDNTVHDIYQDKRGFVWFCTLNGLSRYDGNSFVHFKKRDGVMSLCDNRVKSVSEDKNGCLWISTAAELYSCLDLKTDRFVDYTGNGDLLCNYRKIMFAENGDVWLWGTSDGCRCCSSSDGVFSSQKFDKKTIGSDVVNFVYELSCHKVLISTDKSLYYYVGGKIFRIKDNCNFVKIRILNKHIYLLTDKGDCYEMDARFKLTRKIISQVNCRISYNGGDFAIGSRWMVFTRDGGYSYDLSSFVRSRLTGDLDIPNGKVLRDNKDNVWIYNKTGCLRLVNKNGVKTLQLIPKEKMGYIDYERYHVVEDSNGLVWISTYGNGLFAYDRKTGDIQHFVADTNSDSPIASDYLLSIMEDRSGGIWASSEFSGVSHSWKVTPNGKQIFPIASDRVGRANTIRMIKKLSDGSVAVATRNGWQFRYNKDISELEEKHHYERNLYSMLENGGELWRGTKGDGLFVGTRQYIKSGKKGDYSDDDVYCMLKDRKGNVWLGSFGGGLNLAVKTKDGYRFRNFFSDKIGLQEVRCMFEDKHGKIWLGTSGGLITFNPQQLIADGSNYQCYNSKNSNLPSDEIKCIIQDRRGRLWLAVTGSGIAWCNDVTGRRVKFNILDTDNGLVNDKVQSIIEDRQGDLWIATEYGISRLFTENLRFENFFFSRFVLGNVCSESSSVCLDNGNILFGTNYGLVMINPLKVKCDNKKYSVTYTGLRINGIDAGPQEANSPLSKTLTYVNEIDLKYNQNNFSVDFSTLDFPEKNAVKYSYRLSGYDDEWSKTSSLAFASYKNLPSGTYCLHVKACGSSGAWGDEALLKITVESPWYLTWWAIALYLVLIMCVAYFVLRIVENMNNLRNAVKVEKEMTKYKMVFFTNMSHEFRTPLTLIRASLERLKNLMSDDDSKETAGSLKIMEKNVARMMRLIEQLLEYRKMESNKLTLSLELVDVSKMIKDICSTFVDTAKSNDIDFSFINDDSLKSFYVDRGHLDKITYNLLSNAFKYTPAGGKITVNITLDDVNKKFHLIVADNGAGVQKDKQDKIFDSYMCDNKYNDSFGIGLSLTKSLVVVSKGVISYNENIGGGSVFTVELPTDSSVFEEKDFLMPTEKGDVSHVADDATEDDTMEIDKDFVEGIKPYNKKKILIVEDNDEVRDLVTEMFGRYFEVMSEKNGTDGFTKAKSSDVDLIISDVMMPGKNGFELTKRLKNDFETSHIPIILLTALDDEDSQLEGTQSGADAYVTKPFSMKLLLARTFQLLNQREKLRQKFTNDINAADTSLCSSEQDQVFMRRMNAIVEKQMGDVQFSVERLAEMLNIGRTTFYKKVRGVTGYTPNEYIRIVRLKKAAELLSEGTYNVSEVSYKVGFDNPFYFSKCFKAQFGVAPSQYKKQ